MEQEKLLELLSEGTVISGEEIAGRLHVSRNSVWKAVNRLREAGYAIESGTNRGYRLLSSPDVLRAQDIERALGSLAGRYDIRVLAQTDSTNREAADAAANGAPDGTVVVADTQTAGQGRLGRSFFSPSGSGVYLSFVLRPELEPSELPLITACTGVAVARAVDALAGTQTGIKWVNDLFLDGKKLCGILSRASVDMESRRPEYVVVGIGVNVGRHAFPPELRSVAVSLEEVTGARIARARLIAEILKNCATLTDEVKSRSFLAEYRRRCIMLGRQVVVHTARGSYPAFAEAVDDNAALVVRTEDGVRHTVDSGEVSVKLAE